MNQSVQSHTHNSEYLKQVIKPSSGWVGIDFRELWRYRELLGFLAQRDIKVRYKQSVLGILWAVIQPLVNTLVFTVLFGLLLGSGKQPSAEGTPYFLSTYAAMLPWGIFATALTTAGNSLVANANLIKKVYFPRLITPIVPMVTAMIDFAIQFVILIVIAVGYMIWGGYELKVSWELLTIPLFLLLALLAALGVSLWVASLNALYRDVRFILPFVVQIGKFVTPVVYTTASVIKPENFGDRTDLVHLIYSLNPMVGVIEGFRWALLGASPFPWVEIIMAVPLTLLVLIGGMYYFRRMERIFVDLV